MTCANAERFELCTKLVAQLVAHLCVFVTHAFVSHLLKHLPRKRTDRLQVCAKFATYIYVYVCLCCSVLQCVVVCCRCVVTHSYVLGTHSFICVRGLSLISVGHLFIRACDAFRCSWDSFIDMCWRFIIDMCLSLIYTFV